MTQIHIPVLAGELIDLVDPHIGETAVDLTFGGGGHARLIAGRIGPTGTLICVDRDPAAEERFAELSAELPCHTRFIRADFVSALERLSEEQLAADLVYVDLGMSSMQVDTWARGFSYAYDAPLDMRMDPDQELTARRSSTPGTSAGWHDCCASTARSATPDRSRGAIARARARAELVTTHELVDVIKSSVPVHAPFASGHPARARSRRFESQSTTSSPNSTTRSRSRGSARAGGRFAAISFHSLEDRRGQTIPSRHGARLRVPTRTFRFACAAASPRPSS